MLRGYVLGSAAGITVGVAIALWRPVRLTLTPAIELLRPVPVTAIVPPLIFVLGIDDRLKIICIAFATFFPVVTNTIGGVTAVDRRSTSRSRARSASRARRRSGGDRPGGAAVYPRRAAHEPGLRAGRHGHLRDARRLAGHRPLPARACSTRCARRRCIPSIILLTLVAYAINRLFVLWENRVIGWARTREVHEDAMTGDPDERALRIDGLAKTFGGKQPVTVFEGFSLDVRAGEFLSIVGPSGCGKSTLLQVVAGLIPATRRTRAARRQRRHRRAGAHGLSLPAVCQVALAVDDGRRQRDLRVQPSLAACRREARERAASTWRWSVSSDSADAYPWQLSGGMQQRVAIARALSADPKVLLMDEPFSSVDALTRMELHALISEFWERKRFTTMLVTHDVDEAIFLADRVAVLTRRPATIAELVETGLPRPRRAVETHEDPRFLALRHTLLEGLLRQPDAARCAFAKRAAELVPGVAFFLARPRADRSRGAQRARQRRRRSRPRRRSRCNFGADRRDRRLRRSAAANAGDAVRRLRRSAARAAIALGMLMGSFRAVYNLFEPLTEMLRPIPKPALLPALILFLGLGATMKITLVALAAFFPVLISAVQGTRGVDATMIDMARTFGYRPAQILWKIVLPAAAPYIAVGMR